MIVDIKVLEKKVDHLLKQNAHLLKQNAIHW